MSDKQSLKIKIKKETKKIKQISNAKPAIYIILEMSVFWESNFQLLGVTLLIKHYLSPVKLGYLK